MSKRLLDAIEVCLAALNTGITLDHSLSLYPDLVPALRPELESAQLARSLRIIEVPAGAVMRSRALFLAHASRLRHSRLSGFYRAGFLRLSMAALALVLVFLLSWKGLVVASAQALPGDRMYTLKRAAESVNVYVVPGVEARHEIESRYNLRRSEEVKRLLDLGRIERVSFEGVLANQTPTRWMVAGITVVPTSETRLPERMRAGMVVEVEGLTQSGGWVLAHEIHLRSYQFSGKVESIGVAVWKISGEQFRLLPSTQLDPTLSVGDQALVLVRTEDGNSLSAEAIQRLSPAIVIADPAHSPLLIPAFTPFEIEFSGPVESIGPATWEVAAKTVGVTAGTEIQGGIVAGDDVRVHAWVAADGSLSASQIELVENPDKKAGQDQSQDFGERDGSGQINNGNLENGEDRLSPSGENDPEQEISPSGGEGGGDHIGENSTSSQSGSSESQDSPENPEQPENHETEEDHGD